MRSIAHLTLSTSILIGCGGTIHTVAAPPASPVPSADELSAHQPLEGLGHEAFTIAQTPSTSPESQGDRARREAELALPIERPGTVGQLSEEHLDDGVMLRADHRPASPMQLRLDSFGASSSARAWAFACSLTLGNRGAGPATDQGRLTLNQRESLDARASQTSLENCGLDR